MAIADGIRLLGAATEQEVTIMMNPVTGVFKVTGSPTADDSHMADLIRRLVAEHRHDLTAIYMMGCENLACSDAGKPAVGSLHPVSRLGVIVCRPCFNRLRESPRAEPLRGHDPDGILTRHRIIDEHQPPEMPDSVPPWWSDDGEPPEN